MNTKNLIIAFITVSIAALIVSAFAVFAAARSQYSAILASGTEAEYTKKAEGTESPQSSAQAETSSAPETTKSPESSEIETTAEETVISEEITDTVITDITETTAVPSGYSLKLEGERLVITAPNGTVIRERIIDTSAIHPKDLDALLSGILFSSEDEAISAIYDIIS